MALTDKQQRFADEYLIDMNATRAYLRAGYKCSEAAARSSSADLLANPSIQEYIAEKQKKIGEDNEITVEWILGEIKDTYLQAKEVGELGNANKSLEMLGRYKGIFNDKLKVDATVTKKLEEFFS